MKKDVRRQAAGQAEAKGKPWLGTALYVCGGLLLLAGQVLMQRSKFGRGLQLSALGVAAIFFNLLRPMLPAFDLGALLGWVKSLWPRNGARPLAAGRQHLALAPRWDAWRPFDSETLALSRNWLLLLLGFFAGLMQLFLLGGHTVGACLSLFMLALFGSVYLQNMGQDLSIPFFNDNFKTLLWMSLGLPFQIFGIKLLWNYRYEFTGWAFAIAGSLIMLSALFFKALEAGG